MGVFADWANKYIESGFSVIPIKGKRAFFDNWTSYCRTAPDDASVAGWIHKYHDLNIGLCLGQASGVIGFDLDSQDPKVEQIVRELLPPTPAVKRGKKGFTAFYKFSGQRSQTIRSGGYQVVDILSDGRQTVMPPSIHPETNEPYVWTGSVSLLDGSDDLPDLPQERIDLIVQAIEGASIGSGEGAPRGRNDALKAYVCALADKHSVNEIVQMAINYDTAMFERNRLFTDKTEFKSTDEFSNAFDFVTSVLKSVIKLKQARGEAGELGSSTTSIWPLEAGFHEATETGGWRPLYEEMALYMGTERGYVSCEGAAYFFNGKHHTYCGDLELKSIIANLLMERYTPMKANQFADSVRTFCHRPGFDQVVVPGFLNLYNGTLNLETRKLEPHSKERFFKYALSVNYDSAANCPRWLEFLDFVFEGNQDLISASQEIFGYCLEGGDPWLHKAFFLYGDGRNGKSTWLDTLVALIGKENCSSVPLSALTKPFSVVMADGKLVNAISEGEARDLSSESFKSACSGDTLIAAHKGKPEYSMRWTARMVVSLNNLPNFRDASVGNIERIYTLPFKRYIKPEERDPTIKGQIFKEAPGILNWAIEGLDRLRKRGRLLEVDAQSEVKEEYKKMADSVYEWFTEKMKPSEFAGAVRPGEYYNAYTLWCNAAGRRAVQKAVFSKNLIKHITRRFGASSPSRDASGTYIFSKCMFSFEDLNKEINKLTR